MFCCGLSDVKIVVPVRESSRRKLRINPPEVLADQYFSFERSYEISRGICMAGMLGTLSLSWRLRSSTASR
jgi:hypothetical protein